MRKIRLRKMDQKKYFVVDIDQKELVSKKQKKNCSNLNYIEPLIRSTFAVT